MIAFSAMLLRVFRVNRIFNQKMWQRSVRACVRNECSVSVSVSVECEVCADSTSLTTRHSLSTLSSHVQCHHLRYAFGRHGGSDSGVRARLPAGVVRYRSAGAACSAERHGR